MQKEDMEYVGFWPRAGAAMIDTALIFLLSFPVLLLAAGAWLYGPAEVVLSYVAAPAAVIAFWAWKQATPGKMAISAKIVDAKTGLEPFMWQLVIRYLGYYVSVIPLFMGIVWVAFDKRKQGWHDKLAGTAVVRPKKNNSVSFEA